MIISKLEWDSSFFCYNVGKVNITKTINFDIKEFVSLAKDYKLVYLFSKEHIEDERLELVDEKLLYNIKLTGKIEEDVSNVEKFSKTDEGVKKLNTLVLQSGVYSRFNRDKNFNDREYERLYLKWIQKAIDNNEVLVYKKNGEINGFITLNKKSEKLADIGLMAVDHTARGQGIASRLMKKAINLANLDKFDTLQVVTQRDNIPASNLYEKHGFNIAESTYIYHYWNL